jgi:indole-3-acetate monooxygenase
VKRETPDIRDSISPKTTREWVERARALKPLLEASAAEIEQSRTIPDYVLEALHDAQMFRTVMPRSVGGAELDPATHAQVVAAIAEGDASVAWCIAQAACASIASAYLDPRVAHEIFNDPRAVFTFGYTRGEPPVWRFR